MVIVTHEMQFAKQCCRFGCDDMRTANSSRKEHRPEFSSILNSPARANSLENCWITVVPKRLETDHEDCENRLPRTFGSRL